MKNTLVAATCSGVLVASLVACGGSDDKSGLPTFTSGSSPSASAPSQPTTSTSPTTGTKSGTAPLAAQSTYTYGGLKVVLNLPADIPSTARPDVRRFSDFVQGVGRTTAQNKLDPSLARVASPSVVKYVRTSIEKGSVRGIGPVVFTVSKVQTVTSGSTLLSGCIDQSKLVQVRKDGSRYVDAITMDNPTLKMTAGVNPGMAGPEVTLYTLAVGPC